MRLSPAVAEKYFYGPTILFIIFIDAIFTNLFERPFTKVFNVTGANSTIACVYLACNAD